MKKILLTAAVGAMAFSAFAVPAFAAEGTKEVSVGYDNSIPDPDNPTDADWSVTVPKSFAFNDTKLTNPDMDVVLNTIKNGGLAADKKVEIQVTSKEGYQLVQGADKLAYTLAYPSGTLTGTAKNSIGFLENDATNVALKTLDGTATLTGDTTKADGYYGDVLTYTVNSAVAK